MHFKYDFVRRHQRKLHNIMEELSSEWDVFKGRLFSPWKRIASPAEKKATAKELTTLSNWVDDNRVSKWNYLSPRYKVDRTITCPNSASYGCLDLWGPICSPSSRVCAAIAATTSPWSPNGTCRTSSTRARSLSSTARSKPATR